MQRLAAADPHLVAINLSRNHGHQLALTAGLDLCAGKALKYFRCDYLRISQKLLDANLEIAEKFISLVRKLGIKVMLPRDFDSQDDITHWLILADFIPDTT